MRVAYAGHLATLVKPGRHVFLISVEYDQREMDGPPFAVSGDEVHALFAAEFAVEHWETTQDLDISPRFRDKGLTRLRESLYRLTRR